MTSESFQAFATGRGWKWAEHCAVGTHKGFPFVAQHQPGRVSTVRVTFHLLKGLNMKQIRALRKSLPKGCTFTQPVVGQFQLVCGGVDELLETNLRTGMDLMTQAFQEAEVVPPDTCPCCRKKDCDALALWEGAYRPVHRTCIEERAGAVAAHAEVNVVTGSYVTGFIGAFLGGLVGILPTILSVVLVERIYGLLYALIPICAYKGYQLLRGRMNNGAFWITCIVSLFHLFSMEQIYFYIQIVQEMGLWPTPIDSVLFYWSIYTPGEALMGMASSFLFLALGIWIAWGKIRGTATSAVQDMGLTRESMTPFTPRSTADL